MFPLTVRSLAQLHGFTSLLLLLFLLQPQPGFTRDLPIWIGPPRRSGPPSLNSQVSTVFVNIASSLFLLFETPIHNGVNSIRELSRKCRSTWILTIRWVDTDRTPVWVPQNFCRDSTLPVCNVSEICLKTPCDGLIELSTNGIIRRIQLFTNETATVAFGACNLTGIPLSGERHLRNLGTIYEAEAEADMIGDK